MSIIERDLPGTGAQRDIGGDRESLLERIAERERELEELRSRLEEWETRTAETPQRAPNRPGPAREPDGSEGEFTTLSGNPVEPLYTPLDRPAGDGEEARYHNERLGVPGEFPFTRGPYGTMYRTRLWTMRQFAGFGRRRTSATSSSSPTGRRGSPSPSISPR
jgi:methylmalonyl-CoA mutase N-terminal domain/subunit